MRSRPLLVSIAMALATLGAPAAVGTARAGTPELPSEFRKAPWTTRTLSVGAPNDGHLVRGRRLRPSSSLRLWNGNDVPSHATPQLLKTLERAADRVRATHPGSAVVVHALSHEKGGAIRGKRSHRSGRDADLVLFAVDAKGKPAVAKKLTRFGTSGKADGLAFDDARNWALVEALSRDESVTHLFLSSALRTRLLAWARSARKDEARIEKVVAILFADDGDEPSDALLHVRVACPRDQAAICVESSR